MVYRDFQGLMYIINIERRNKKDYYEKEISYVVEYINFVIRS